MVAKCRLLSLARLHFHGLGCRKLPVSVWLGAQGTRMQFTSLLCRCTASGTRYGEYLLPGEFLCFHRDIMQRSPAGKMLNIAHFQHISQAQASPVPPAVFIDLSKSEHFNKTAILIKYLVM